MKIDVTTINRLVTRANVLCRPRARIIQVRHVSSRLRLFDE
jgi:hypothetical protein